MSLEIIPSKATAKAKKDQKYREIKYFYRQGFSMDQICVKTKSSKTTVFFAINGRSVRSDQRKKKRRKLKSFFKK